MQTLMFLAKQTGEDSRGMRILVAVLAAILGVALILVGTHNVKTQTAR